MLRCFLFILATLHCVVALKISNHGYDTLDRTDDDEGVFATSHGYVADQPAKSLLRTIDGNSCAEPAMMHARGFSRVCCNFFVECYNPIHWKRFNGLTSARDTGFQADLHHVREEDPPAGERHHAIGPPAKPPDKLPNYTAMLPQLSLPGISIYVPPMNMLDFLEVFVKLPPSASVTVVTGNEDLGMPRELWGEGRPELSRRAPKALSYRQFIADPRLNHWFVQNYDLTGCANHGCSPISEDDPIAQKVTPIPIGMEFHIRAEENQGGRESVAEQHSKFYGWRKEIKPFLKKKDDVLWMPFAKADRDNVTNIRLPDNKIEHFHKRRVVMWNRLADTYMFVCSPFGHGMDTYRVWETLAFGSIPVVRSSSLDRLYRQFPIIIVPDWKSVDENSFAKWKAEIISRFGPEPVSGDVLRKVRMKYWVDLVKETAKPGSSRRRSTKAVEGVCLASGAGDIKKEWGCKQNEWAPPEE